MEEENSWLRRTKFSNTVYHRSGSTRLDIPPFHHFGQITGVRTKVVTNSGVQPSDSSASEVQKSPSIDKVRDISPKFRIRRAILFSDQSGSTRLDLPPFHQSGQITGVGTNVISGSGVQPSDSSASEVQKSPSIDKVRTISPKFRIRLAKPFTEDKFDRNKVSTHNARSVSGLPPLASCATQVQHSSGEKKFRAVSPVPQTKISPTFKEAKSNRKRFSTPQPDRRDADKGAVSKLLQKDSCEKRAPVYLKSNTNIGELGHFAAMKIDDKKRSRKESTWTKYFDHAGGRVTAIESADEWMIDLSELFLGVKFDHGANSQLYHGIYKDEPVAVKIIRVPDDDENEILGSKLEKQFTREVTLLARLQHPNVLKFIAACKKAPVFCIITEYMSEGSLRVYLRKREQKLLPLQKLNSMALDIARGMEFIHSQGVIHRDLKPENILINQDFQLKIADFGIACEEAICDSLIDDPGTYRWMAPEMLKRKSYGKKVDIYSFGLILLEMVTGSIPYKDMTPSQAAFAVLNKNLRPVIPEDCPSAMRSLIEQCWSLQPDKRPEFWQVVKVLEQFESSLASDGTLNLVPNPMCQDLKKGILYRMQKLGAAQKITLPMPKPKFA